MSCNIHNPHHWGCRHGEYGPSRYGGCQCGCGCRCGCGCNCRCGCGGNCGCASGFRRQFTSRAERIASLEEYLSELRNEVAAVTEAIEELKKQL